MQIMVVLSVRTYTKIRMAIKLNKSTKVAHHSLFNHQSATFNMISTRDQTHMIWLFVKSFVTKDFVTENIIDQSLMTPITKGAVEKLRMNCTIECKQLSLFSTNEKMLHLSGNSRSFW